MYKQLTFLFTITALAQQAEALRGWGPSLHFNPIKTSWIRESNTTLVLPAVLAPAADEVSLWPGMLTSKGDLIQALAVANNGGTRTVVNPKGDAVTIIISDDGCEARHDQWCIMATTLIGAIRAGCKEGHTTEQCREIRGVKAVANEGDHVLMHYKYNDSTEKYDQTVYLNGDSVSTLSTDSGHAYSWETQVECQSEGCSSTLQGHRYLDTVLRLDSADPNYGNTVNMKETTNSGVETSDGGLTWSIQAIDMPAVASFDIDSRTNAYRRTARSGFMERD